MSEERGHGQGGAPKERRTVSQRIGASARRVGSVYLGAVAGDVKGDLTRLQDRVGVLRRMLRPARSSRQESFGDAQHRMGLTEDDLAKRQRFLERSSYVYMLVGTLALMLLVWSPWTQRPLSQFTVSLAVLALCVSRGAATRFRRSQIESRELFGFADWALGRKGQY